MAEFRQQDKLSPFLTVALSCHRALPHECLARFDNEFLTGKRRRHYVVPVVVQEVARRGG